MNTKTIDNALLYYGITDEDYKNQCYDCLKKIKQNDKLQKEFNDLFNAIFVKKSDEIKKLWNIKSTDLIFSENVHPYITNLLLLRGYKIHQKNIDSYKLDEQQIYIHKLRVKETLTLLLNYFPAPVAVTREATKMFEETVFIYSEEDIEKVNIKGEFVIVVNNKVQDTARGHNEQILDYNKIINELSSDGLSSKDILKVMKTLGLKRNDAYELINKAQNK